MEGLTVAVGCPIRSRAWIFPQWVEHVRTAFDVAGLKPHWVFNVGIEREDDDNTFRLATELFRHEPGMWCEDMAESEFLPAGTRKWGEGGYRRMVHIRNRLLHLVRAMRPNYFLSLDSDILIHPDGLVNLLDDLENGIPSGQTRIYPNAAGGKAYLSQSTSQPCPTYANLLGYGGLVARNDSEGVFPVDVLMAIKLMSPAAYNVDYDFSVQGEDIGWSVACRAAGLTLAWDGRACSKHVMVPEQLTKVDPRVGW